MPPKYSICMTCFNEVSTVRESINSLLRQLNEDYEVIIVDNFSKDGTYEILKEFEHSNSVKIVQERSSRGKGRQFALEHASGEYVIANLDLDDLFLPVLGEIVGLYHEKANRKVLAIFNSSPPPDLDTGWIQNITLGPRELFTSLGGWRDLDLFEDWDVWSRAHQAGKYAWGAYRFAVNDTVHPESKHALIRLRQRYERYRSRLRLGMRIFSSGEKIYTAQRLPYVAARVVVSFQGTLSGQDPAFKSLDPRSYVDLGYEKRRC